MARFLILYNSAVKSRERMAQSTPEQVKAGMDSWIRWKEDAEKSAKFEWGMPLQAEANITSEGVGESSSMVSGYSMMEGDKETIIELLKVHPHLQMPGASIDVLEFVPMDGIDQS